MANLPLVRVALYSTLAVISFLVFCLCCARINYTEPLFYESPVAELLVTCIFTLILVPLMVIVIRNRMSHHVIGRAWFEIAGLAFIWIFWISGAGSVSSLTSAWDTFGYKDILNHLLPAITAFAWIAWLLVSILLVGSLVFAIRRRGWQDETHESWGMEEKV